MNSCLKYPLIALFTTTLVFYGCRGNSGSDQKEENSTRQIAKTKIQKPAFSQEDSARFNSFFTQLPDGNKFNGNVLIYHEGKLFENSYGLADFKSGKKLKSHHVFQLASVSKPLTAALILMLQEKELLRITDSVQFYFPDFPYEGITLEMLLSHRSGLPNYMYITDDVWEDKEMPICNENILQTLFSDRPDKYYAPDSRFNYCNTNYFMLAAVVEKVTGIGFEAAAQKYLFQPAQMKNTFVYSNMNYLDLPDLAVGHSAFGKSKPDFYLNGVTGDKGVFSTAKDLYLFERALTHYELIRKNTIDDMHKPRSPFDRKGKSYALGWRVDNNFESQVVYHNGWWRGYRSYFIRIPEKDLVVIALSNTTRGSFIKVGDIMNLVRPFIQPVPKPTGGVSDENLV